MASRANKLTAVRLSVVAQELLTGILRDHYGLRSNTAILETLIREKVRELRTASTASHIPLATIVDPREGDEDEIDAERFRHTRAEFDR